ncbi:MAG: glycosyltransferase, partial [Actinobacteria bacterium]|nr:glycosyltransferase [Actinomycetota bacterium]
PTVANIIPGITDEIIQTGKYGFLVNCEDTERFAAALKIMMRNPGLRERMGKNASLEILNNYNINDIAMKYLALYESLTVKKRIAFSKQPRKLTHRANEIQ